MSLDQNLFTLSFVPRPAEPHIIELVDPGQVVHYRKERKDGVHYDISLFDPLTDSLLATVTAPSATSKHKTVHLYNPSVPVELKSTGIFTFRWSFTWEEHDFEWKKEECFIIRKPDPPVLIAITKDPSNKTKTRAVQILDYNIKRFDIVDRKGLEIVLLSSLLSFQDYFDAKIASAQAPAKATVGTEPSAPPPPPKPSPLKASTSGHVTVRPKRTGLERIAELQRGKLNELIVTEECEADEYAEYCCNLLENDNVEYVILRASTAVSIPKVLQAAQRTKRRRLDAGDRNELVQYIQYGSTMPQAGTITERRNRSDNIDKEPTQSSESFIVRLCKIKPAPSSQLRVDRRTVLNSQLVRDVVNESEIITRSKGKNVDRGVKEEVVLVSTSDMKGKVKVDKRADEKEQRKREKEEGLARKMKEKYEADERRRKEASEEGRKDRGKPLKETKAEIHDRRQRTKEAEEERRKELMREAEEKKERERRAKDKTRGKGKAAQRPSPEPPTTDARLEARLTVKGRTAARPTMRPASPERPLAKTSALRTSGRFAASSSPRSPSFDKGPQAHQHLRFTPSPGTAGRPYNAVRQPVTMYGTTYAPVLLAEEMV